MTTLAEFCEGVLADTRTLSISLDQDLGLVVKVAKAMCAEMYGPLEKGSWALLDAHGKDRLCRYARAAILAI